MQKFFTLVRVAAFLGAFSDLAAVLHATTLQQLPLSQMIGGSTAVVRARVTASTAILRHNDVYTLYTLDVLERWDHHPGRVQPHEVAVPGGVAGGIRQILSGAPALETGTEYVLFLWQGRGGLVQLMGLSQGVFRIDGDQALQAPTTERMLDSGGRPVNAPALAFKLTDLKARVLANQTAAALGGAR